MSRIIGYQVCNEHGEHWDDSPSYLILSMGTAIEHLQMARVNGSGCWNMLAILDGDIEEPVYEMPLCKTDDQYAAIGVSTAHLSAEDKEQLSWLASSTESNMIMERDTGWLMKLYEDNPVDRKGFSEHFYRMVKQVHEAGFRMIEFDCDAADYQEFEVFE